MIGTMIIFHYANRATMDTLALVVAVDSLFSSTLTMLTASALQDSPTIRSAVWIPSCRATPAVLPSTKTDTTTMQLNSSLRTVRHVHHSIHPYVRIVKRCPNAGAAAASCTRVRVLQDTTSHGAQRQNTSWAECCSWLPLSCLPVSSLPIGGEDEHCCSGNSVSEAAVTDLESHPNPEVRAVMVEDPPLCGESREPAPPVEVALRRRMMLVMEVFSRNYYFCVDVLHDYDCYQQLQSFSFSPCILLYVNQNCLDCVPFLIVCISFVALQLMQRCLSWLCHRLDAK